MEPESIGRRRANYKSMLEKAGNLSPKDAEELARLDFDSGPNTLNEQVDRYCLKVKSQVSRKAARQMRKETKKIMSRGVNSLGDAKDLMRVIYKYVSGGILSFNGNILYMTNNQMYVNYKPVSE